MRGELEGGERRYKLARILTLAVFESAFILYHNREKELGQVVVAKGRKG